MKPIRSAAHDIALFLAGPFVWAAHFFLLYVGTGFAAPSVVQAAALGATALLMLVALALVQAPAVRRPPVSRAFLRRASLALAGLSALGILWATLPVLIL